MKCNRSYWRQGSALGALLVALWGCARFDFSNGPSKVASLSQGSSSCAPIQRDLLGLDSPLSQAEITRQIDCLDDQFKTALSKIHGERPGEVSISEMKVLQKAGLLKLSMSEADWRAAGFAVSLLHPEGRPALEEAARARFFDWLRRNQIFWRAPLSKSVDMPLVVRWILSAEQGASALRDLLNNRASLSSEEVHAIALALAPRDSLMQRATAGAGAFLFPNGLTGAEVKEILDGLQFVPGLLNEEVWQAIATNKIKGDDGALARVSDRAFGECDRDSDGSLDWDELDCAIRVTSATFDQTVRKVSRWFRGREESIELGSIETLVRPAVKAAAILASNMGVDGRASAALNELEEILSPNATHIPASTRSFSDSPLSALFALTGTRPNVEACDQDLSKCVRDAFLPMLQKGAEFACGPDPVGALTGELLKYDTGQAALLIAFLRFSQRDWANALAARACHSVFGDENPSQKLDRWLKSDDFDRGVRVARLAPDELLNWVTGDPRLSSWKSKYLRVNRSDVREFYR